MLNMGIIYSSSVTVTPVQCSGSDGSVAVLVLVFVAVRPDRSELFEVVRHGRSVKEQEEDQEGKQGPIKKTKSSLGEAFGFKIEDCQPVRLYDTTFSNDFQNSELYGTVSLCYHGHGHVDVESKTKQLSRQNKKENEISCPIAKQNGIMSSSTSSSSYSSNLKGDRSGTKRKKNEVQPKLARECLTIDDTSSSNSSDDTCFDNDGDDSDDRSDSSSLEILPPVVRPTQRTKQQPWTTTKDDGRGRGRGGGGGGCRDRVVDETKKGPSTSRKTTTDKSSKTANLQGKKRDDTDGALKFSFSDPDEDDSDDPSDDDDDDEFLRLKSAFSTTRMKPPPPTYFATATTSTSSGDSAAAATTSTNRNGPGAMTEKKKKDHEKERKKREREEKKEREKQARAQKRQDERDARERKLIEERIVKKRQRQMNSQATGKYKHSEIAVLMEKPLHNDDPYGLVESLSEDFLVHRVDDISLSFSSSSAASSIQFIRKDYLAGGAEAAVKALLAERTNKPGAGTTIGTKKTTAREKTDYEHIPTLALTILPDDFISLLKRQDREEDDEFPALQDWLQMTISRWQRMWSSTETPRLFLLLIDVSETLDDKWVELRRHRNGSTSSLPTAHELQDAIQWLLINYQVECIELSTSKLDTFQSTVHKMTRGLSDLRYMKDASALECVKKIKPGGDVDQDDPLQCASDVWLRQLQQVPRLSEAMAQNVVATYPTCQSLWQAYRDLDDDEDAKASLLANILSAGARQQQKVSHAVYRIMTSDDPDEMVT